VNRQPLIGEGVIVPWGLDEVRGEVVDLRGPAHAIVAVPIEGSSGEQLDTVEATFNIDAMRELPRWRVVGSQQGVPAPGADAYRAWYVDASRNGDSARVEVRVARTVDAVAHAASLAEDSQRALATNGRSAVEKFSYRYRLPRTVVVTTQGVFEANG
jgi:hypothetical protein